MYLDATFPGKSQKHICIYKIDLVMHAFCYILLNSNNYLNTLKRNIIY